MRARDFKSRAGLGENGCNHTGPLDYLVAPPGGLGYGWDVGRIVRRHFFGVYPMSNITIPVETPTEQSRSGLYTAVELFKTATTAWSGKIELSLEISKMAQDLPNGLRAQIAFHLLTAGTHDEKLDTPTKAFALALADEMGADWAQWLYRFAVLVTKLA